MSNYLKDKPNRKPLSFLYLVLNDYNNFTEVCKERTHMFNGEESNQQFVITSNLYLRSSISLFEILTTQLQNLDKHISYKFTIDTSPLATDYEKLISTTTTSNGTHSITVSTYNWGTLGCSTIENDQLGQTNTCLFDKATYTCQCDRQGTLVLTEEVFDKVLTKVEKITPHTPIDNISTTIVVVVIIVVFAIILCCCAVCIFVCWCKRRKVKTPEKQEKPIIAEEDVELSFRFADV